MRTVTLHEHISPALCPATAGNYTSPPLPHADALQLARVLLRIPQLPTGPGPWTRAVPGGTITVALTEPQS